MNRREPIFACMFLLVFVEFAFALSVQPAGAAFEEDLLSPPLEDHVANEDIREPDCFDGTFFFEEPHISDCFGAAQNYKNDPFFKENVTYTTNEEHLHQQADRKTPIHFFYLSCMIYVDGLPGSQDDKFTLESQWPRVSLLIRKCLLEPKPGHKFGGLVKIGKIQQNAGFIACLSSEPKGVCSQGLSRQSTRNVTIQASSFNTTQTYKK